MAFSHPHYQPHEHEHIQVVDGLRAFAIILVIWFHFWIQTWQSADITILNQRIHLDLLAMNGQVGVDILLFITGFGLFYAYATHKFEKKQLQSLKIYFFHRLIRILPSYFLAVMIGLFLFTSEGLTARQNWPWQLVTHLTFLHGFFPDTQGTISAVFWTLATEFQFYCLFPIVAWAFMRKPIVTFTAMVVMAILFRYLGLFFFNGEANFWFRQAPAFFDVYACGMLAAYLTVFFRSVFRSQKMYPLLTTLNAILSAVVFVYLLTTVGKYTGPEGRETWLLYHRLALGFLGMTFVLSIAFSYSWVQWWFTNPVMQFISKISYNWYLWHYMILLELKLFIPYTTEMPQGDPVWRWSLIRLALPAGLVVATIMTYVWEKPWVKYGLRKLDN